MTPTGSRFRIKLDNELLRMENEWFFKWHFIGRDGPVKIDGFDGRTISYSGLAFAGSPRTVYWSTIQRYIRGKVSTLFDELEVDIKEYSTEIRREAIEEVRMLILGFANQIRQHAVEKDRILRGNGHSFPEATPSMWRSDVAGQINERAAALSLIYVEQHENQPTGRHILHRLNRHYKSNPFFYWAVPVAVAIALAVLSA